MSKKIQQNITPNPDLGFHNADLNKTIERLKKQSAYKDLSTVIVVPSLEKKGIPPKVVFSWWNMMTPPNQLVYKLSITDMEVGEAYSFAIDMILNNPVLSKCKYMLTMEHDNIPESDSFIKLLERAEEHPEFACVGGLYFTKGMMGQPQIWGDPKDPVMNFRPQLPAIDPNTGLGALVECCGTGMGFNLFRIDMFKDPKLRKPWFKTTSSAAEGINTQDLYFWRNARENGYRCAVDCNIKIGHYDVENKFSW